MICFSKLLVFFSLSIQLLLGANIGKADVYNQNFSLLRSRSGIIGPQTQTAEGYILLTKGDDVRFDLGFREGRKLEAREVNDYLVNGQGKDLDGQPYWAGTEIDEVTLGTKDEIIYFVENYKDGEPNPGQYASKDPIYTLSELRGKLAVKEAWKKTANEPTLRAYRVKASLRSRSGIIGPQTENGVRMSGGGHQYEVIDYLGGENWKNYLEEIPELEKKLR